jgi:hypothetical protein
MEHVTGIRDDAQHTLSTKHSEDIGFGLSEVNPKHYPLHLF